MDSNNVGNDEVDSFYELIGAISLMLFCGFAIAFMAERMSGYITHYHHRDKIEVAANAAEVGNPMCYTGYQAYMFAWMMDPYSDVSITWVSADTARTDGADNKHVTISTLDDHGNVISNFLAYRNQLITGGIASPTRNVKNIIKQVHSSQVDALYAHDSVKCGHWFYLTYTGDYTTNSKPYYDPSGTVVFDRRKQYTWILTPVGN